MSMPFWKGDSSESYANANYAEEFLREQNPPSDPGYGDWGQSNGYQSYGGGSGRDAGDSRRGYEGDAGDSRRGYEGDAGDSRRGWEDDYRRRDRERSPRERRRDRSRSRSHERDRERGDRDRYRERDRDRDRDRDRYRERDAYDERHAGSASSARRSAAHAHASTTIMLRGLPQATTEGDVREKLEVWGGLRDVRVVRTKGEKGEPRGEAFIEFNSLESARSVMECTSGQVTIGGRTIMMEYAPSDGASRDGGHRDYAQQEYRPREHTYQADWICDRCKGTNFARRQACFQCSHPRTGREGESRPMEDGELTNVLIVRNIDIDTPEDQLHRYFIRFGRLREVRLIRDKMTQQSRGFAFVEFWTSDEAKTCLEYPDHSIEGRVPRMAYARGKDSFMPSHSAAKAGAGAEAVEQALAVASERASASQHQQAAAAESDQDAAVPSHVPEGYVWDASSKYYVNVKTGFYYDASTQLFYDGHNRVYYYFDYSNNQYVQCGAPAGAPETATSAAADTAAATAASSFQQPKNEEMKKGLEAAKAAEEFAKKQNKESKKLLAKQKKDHEAKARADKLEREQAMAAAAMAASAPVVSISKKTVAAAPAAAALQTNTVFNTIKSSESRMPAPAAAASAAKGGASFACTLCNRGFATAEQLKKHEDFSALHKENLAKQNAAGGVQYKDRAADRRKLQV